MKRYLKELYAYFVIFITFILVSVKIHLVLLPLQILHLVVYSFEDNKEFKKELKNMSVLELINIYFSLTLICFFTYFSYLYFDILFENIYFVFCLYILILILNYIFKSHRLFTISLDILSLIFILILIGIEIYF